jgi:hypothetical protein
MTARPLPMPPPPLARQADAIWVTTPLSARRVSAGLAMAIVDGHYLAVRPLPGLLAPPIALFAGLVIGAFHPGFELIYTEALWLLMLVALLGSASGALGFYFTLGFVVGDLLIGDHPVWRIAADGPESFAGRYGSLLISYALMAVLAVGVPMAAKSLAADFMPPPSTPRALRLLVGMGALVFITGVLVFAWVQTAPLLVRPVFVWPGRPPTVDAIARLQENGGLIVLAAVLAAAVRVAVQAWLAGQAMTAVRWFRC